MIERVQLTINREQHTKKIMTWGEFISRVESLGIQATTKIAFIDVENGFELRKLKTEIRTDGAAIIRT